MKNSLLALILCLISGVFVQSQNFKLGVVGGLSTGDATDKSSFVLGIDAYYFYTKENAFLQLGTTTGFRHYFHDQNEDAQFVPLAVAARLKIFEFISGGLDVGYALGVNTGNEGGFYYRPVIGFDIADTIELITSYESVVSAGSFNAGNFNVGFLFAF